MIKLSGRQHRVRRLLKNSMAEIFYRLFILQT